MPLPPKPVFPSAPPAPVRGEPQATFANKANDFVAWQSGTFPSAMNTAIAWMEGAVDEAVVQAGLAANQVTLAAGQVTLAEEQVGLAEDQVTLAAGQVALATAQVGNASTEADRAATEADRAELAASLAEATASFVGRWEDATGAGAAGESYAHDGRIWILLAAVADITATEPGMANPDWQLVGDQVPPSVAVGEVRFSYSDLEAAGGGVWRALDGSIKGQSSEPELFAMVGVGEPDFDVLAAIPDLGVAAPKGLDAVSEMSTSAVYVAMTFGDGSSANLRVWVRSGDSLSLINNYSPSTSANPSPPRFSSNGLWVGFGYSGFGGVGRILTAYRDGISFSDPVTIDAGLPDRVYSVAFSPDATYLAAGIQGAAGGIPDDRLLWYKRSGTSFTALPPPAEQPLDRPRDMDFSPVSNHFVLGFTSGIIVYALDTATDTLTAIPGIEQPPGFQAVSSVRFSPDGNWLIAVRDQVSIYRRNGNIFDRVSVEADWGVAPWAASFSRNSQLIAITNAVNKVIILSLANGVWRPRDNPEGDLAAIAYGPVYPAFSGNSHLIVTGDAENQAQAFKADFPFNPDSQFQVPKLIQSQSTLGWKSRPAQGFLRVK